MKTTCPFSEKEIEAYMQKAFEYVNNNYPESKGSYWDDRIKESLRLQYAKGNEDATDTYDAHMFADLVFDGYYES